MKTPNFNLDLIYVYQPMCYIVQDQLQFVDTPSPRILLLCATGNYTIEPEYLRIA